MSDVIAAAIPVDDDSDADFTDDGQAYKEIRVYNHVNVETRHYVHSVNGHETFTPNIGAGNRTSAPGYVTERIAEYLWLEWGIDLDKPEWDDIDVIDPDDPEVLRL